MRNLTIFICFLILILNLETIKGMALLKAAEIKKDTEKSKPKQNQKKIGNLQKIIISSILHVDVDEKKIKLSKDIYDYMASAFSDGGTIGGIISTIFGQLKPG